MTIEMRSDRMWEDSGQGWDEHVHEDGAQRYCFGGKGGGTNTVSQVQIPEWMQAAGADNYARAVGITTQPYQSYGGNTVAGMPWQSQDVAQRVAQLQGVGQQRVDDATRVSQNVAGFQGQQVGTNFDPNAIAAQGLTGMNRDAYTNPYLQQVRDTGLAALEQSRLKAIGQTGEQAIASGAFGGSRHAVMEAATNAQAAAKAAEFAAQTGAAGYDAATAAMTNDANRYLSASQSNQSAAMQAQQLGLTAQTTNANNAQNAAALRLQAGGQMGNLANVYGQVAARELALQDTVSQQQRGYEQAVLDDAAQRWTDQYNWNSGLTGLGIRESALGMTPYGTSTNTKSDGGSGANTAGLVVGGIGAGATIASALSDPDEKRGMEKIGRDRRSGLDIFAFDYELDGPRGAKRVGLDAEQVEEKFPDAVTEVGGVKSLLFGELPQHLRPLVSGHAAPPDPKPRRGKRGRH